MTATDPYTLLGVATDASTAEIKAAWRAKMRTTHPDLGGDHDESVALQAAYELLVNPERRAEFDAAVAEREAGERRYQERVRADRERRRRAEQQRQAGAEHRSGGDGSQRTDPRPGGDRRSHDSRESGDGAEDLIDELRRRFVYETTSRASTEERRRRFDEAYERQSREQSAPRRCRSCSTNRLVESDCCWAHSTPQQRAASLNFSAPFCCSVTKSGRGCYSFGVAQGLCGTHRSMTSTTAGATADPPDPSEDDGAGSSASGPGAEQTTRPGSGASEPPPDSRVPAKPTTSTGRRRDRQAVAAAVAGIALTLSLFTVAGVRVARWLGSAGTDSYVLEVGEPATLGPEVRRCGDTAQGLTAFGPDEAGDNWVAAAQLDVPPEEAGSYLVVELNGRSRSLDLNGEDLVFVAAVDAGGPGLPTQLPEVDSLDEDTDESSGVKLVVGGRDNLDLERPLNLAGRYGSEDRLLSVSVSAEVLEPFDNDGFDVEVRLLQGRELNEVRSCST
jgi:curved DNA-binding protein CbpA